MEHYWKEVGRGIITQKSYSLIILLAIILQFNSAVSQDSVKGGFRKCIVNIYNFKYENERFVDKSKEFFHIYKYNEHGLKNEDEYYWNGTFAYVNKFSYDSNNTLIENLRISDHHDNNYRIKYLYDKKGNNYEIFCYNKGDTLISYQSIIFNESGKEIKHNYYSSGKDSLDGIEYFKYNENGLIIEKKFSSIRYIFRDIYDIYTYDTNNFLVEINRHQSPEPKGDEDELTWEKDEISYVFSFCHPARPFIDKYAFEYDGLHNLTEKSSYQGKNPGLIHKYFYDNFNNIIKEVVTGKSHGPYQELIYQYSK